MNYFASTSSYTAPSRCKGFVRLNNYQVIKNIMMTTKETTTGKGPSSCESTFNEIKAHEVQTLPKRLIAVAKLPVELLEDHNVSQVLCRTAKASCFQRAHSVHVQLELCGSSFSPSVTPRLHIRVYPRWIQLQITLKAPETQASSQRCVDQLESFASKKLRVCETPSAAKFMV